MFLWQLSTFPPCWAIKMESLYFHFLLENFQQIMELEGWFGGHYLLTTQCFSFLLHVTNCSALNTTTFPFMVLCRIGYNVKYNSDIQGYLLRIASHSIMYHKN